MLGDIDGDGGLEATSGYEWTQDLVVMDSTNSKTVTAGAGNGTSAATLSLGVQFGATTSDSLTLELEGTSASALAIASLNATTVSGARSALSSIDTALTTLNSRRAYLGATQRRLESMLTTSQQRELAITAAESRTRDLDFSEASTALAKVTALKDANMFVAGQTNHLSTALMKKLLGSVGL